MNKRCSSILLLGCVIALAAVVSSRALSGPLVLDSVKLYQLEAAWAEGAGPEAVYALGAFGRVVAVASFSLNFEIADGLDPFQVKATNMFVHVLCGLLVFLLARALCIVSGHEAHSWVFALTVAALWILSPANLTTAWYAIQRMAQLSTFFVLFSLLAYVQMRTRSGAWVRGLWAIVFGLGFVGGLLSKETALLLPVFLVLVEGLLVRNWTRTRVLLLSLAVVLLGAFAMALLLIRPEYLDYAGRDFTLMGRVLTETRVVWAYLRELIIPVNADPYVYFDDFVVSTGLANPPSTLAAISGLLLLTGLSIAVWRKAPLITFGVLFYLAGHLLESTVFPLEIAFMHRNYLPSFGVYVAISAGMLMLIQATGRPFVAGSILAGYAVLFASTAYMKADSWSSSARLVAAAVRYHPDSPRALAGYAQALTATGNFNEALAVLDRLVQSEQGRILRTQVQRLYVLCLANRAIENVEYDALSAARFGLAIEQSQALGNLLALYQGARCPQLNLAALVSALDARINQIDGDHEAVWDLAYYADAFLLAGGKVSLALDRLSRRMRQGEPRAGFFMVDVLLMQGREGEARAVLETLRQMKEVRQNSSYMIMLDELASELTVTDVESAESEAEPGRKSR